MTFFYDNGEISYELLKCENLQKPKQHKHQSKNQILN